MPLSRRAHPAKRTRQAVGAASGVTYLAVTAVIGVSVRSQAEAAETVAPPVDDTVAPSTVPDALAFAGAAQPAPALPVLPEMTAIDGVPTSLVDPDLAEAATTSTLATDTTLAPPTQAPTTQSAAPTTTARPAPSTTSSPATETTATPPTTGSGSNSAPSTTAAPTSAPPTTATPTTAPPTTPAPTTSAPPTTPTTDAS